MVYLMMMMREKLCLLALHRAAVLRKTIILSELRQNYAGFEVSLNPCCFYLSHVYLMSMLNTARNLSCT